MDSLAEHLISNEASAAQYHAARGPHPWIKNRWSNVLSMSIENISVEATHLLGKSLSKIQSSESYLNKECYLQ